MRILSASHKSLAEEVARQRFRQDLYYRINVIELTVPSLRERQEDIPELTLQMLSRMSEETPELEPLTISDEALQTLCEYPFPGNIRELENILQRAVTLSENRRISVRTLDLQHAGTPLGGAEPTRSAVPAFKQASAPGAFVFDEAFSLERHLEAIERRAIEQALQECRWNKTLAAKRLGMSFRSLRYRLKKLGLD